MELHIGVVVDNEDPEKTGKVKIRIPDLNGSDKSSLIDDDDALEWFEPCSPFFGGYQYGSFIVPPVGAMIWCIIEDVEDSEPYRIYLGGVFGTGTKYGKEFGGKNVPKKKLETPKEAVIDYPSTSIIFKSLAGSVIYVDGEGSITLKNSDGAAVVISEDSITLDADKAYIKVQNDGLIKIKGELQDVKENLIVSDSDLTITDMNVKISKGNFNVSKGDATIETGNFTVSTGDSIVSTGDAIVSTGDVIVSNGDVIIPNGEVITHIEEG